jgi:hypothetical protein
MRKMHSACWWLLLLVITGSAAWNLETCRVWTHPQRSFARTPLAFVPTFRPGLTLLERSRARLRGIQFLRMRDGSEEDDRLVGTQYSRGSGNRQSLDMPRNGFQEGRGRPEHVGIGKEVPASWQEGNHYVMGHGARWVLAHFP